MRTHLSNTRIQHERDPDGTIWLKAARGIVGGLRQMCEAAVEGAISPVLRTFASKVNTKGLAKLSAITVEDAELRPVLCPLTQTSKAMNFAAPTSADIEAEMGALDNWLEAVIESQRQEST